MGKVDVAKTYMQYSMDSLVTNYKYLAIMAMGHQCYDEGYLLRLPNLPIKVNTYNFKKDTNFFEKNY